MMDARIIDYVRNRRGGKIISDPAQVGGYSIMNFVAPEDDSDEDWLPDTFEAQYGAMSAESDLDADDYPAIEEFENGTNPITPN